jgi:hypothetical protein
VHVYVCVRGGVVVGCGPASASPRSAEGNGSAQRRAAEAEARTAGGVLGRPGCGNMGGTAVRPVGGAAAIGITSIVEPTTPYDTAAVARWAGARPRCGPMRQCTWQHRGALAPRLLSMKSAHPLETTMCDPPSLPQKNEWARTIPALRTKCCLPSPLSKAGSVLSHTQNLHSFLA